MADALPSDFPGFARVAVSKITAVDASVGRQITHFISLYWGDINAIDNSINNVLVPEANRARDSIARLDEGHAKLTNQDTVSYWKGNARQEYVDWRADFKANTLDKYVQNIWAIKEELDSTVGTIKSIRAHLIAMVIELAAAAASAASSNPVGYVAAAAALLGMLGTWFDYELRVQNDLDQHGRKLETLREKSKLDRGGGTVSRPFKTDIIGDWDNWQHSHPQAKK